jgi:hypothetical protein
VAEAEALGDQGQRRAERRCAEKEAVAAHDPVTGEESCPPRLDIPSRSMLRGIVVRRPIQEFLPEAREVFPVLPVLSKGKPRGTDA